MAKISPEVNYWILGVHSIQESLNNEELIYKYLTSHLHPRYQRYYIYDIFDLSIFVLDRQITFGPKVLPICLPNDGEDKLFWNRYVTVAGWGRISMGGPPTDLLMETNVMLKDDEECKKTLKLPNYINKGMICAYENYKDSCQVS